MEWDPIERSPKQNYFFLTSAVAPRPIAWVTTTSVAGIVNAAPFSWFQAVCADPMLVMLSIGVRADGSPKDSLANIEATGEFVVNVVVEDAAEAMVASSGDYAPDVSETQALGLATAPSRRVRPPRLEASPVHLECRLEETHRYGAGGSAVHLVVGRVVHVHAEDHVLDGRGNVDPAKAPLMARLGGNHYVVVRDTLALQRPRQEDLLRREPDG